MITIVQTPLNIFKHDQSFREIRSKWWILLPSRRNKFWCYYDSRKRFLLAPFWSKGPTSKRILNRLFLMDSAFMFEKIMKLVFCYPRQWYQTGHEFNCHGVYGQLEKQLKLLATGLWKRQPRSILLTIFWTKSPTSYAVYHEYDTGW